MTVMQSLTSLGGIFLLACCSPGPVFLLIVSVAARQGRADGMRVGFGVAAATFVWSSFTILGLGAIMASVVWSQTVIRLIAGAYLFWLGIKMVRSGLQSKASVETNAQFYKSPFRNGFFASLTNPKALAFFGSAFALTLPAAPSLHYNMAAVCLLTLLSALWHVGLALLFASAPMQQSYKVMKRQIDLSVGVVLACMGGGLIAQSFRRSG